MSRQLLKVKFLSDFSEKVYENGSLLSYQSNGSSGFDLRAISVLTTKNEKYDLSDNNFVLEPNQRVQVTNGVSFAIAQGYEIQVRSRSGLSWKNGVFVLNSPGTVDSDYRGEVCTILYNSNTEPFVIKLGDRISQAVISVVTTADFEIVKDLDSTERGSGGFGSTGV